MKISKNFFGLVMIAFLAVSFTGYAQLTKHDSKEDLTTSLSWYEIEDLPALQKKQEKKVIVDIYTSWCKWCKVMDEQTFNDPKVIAYLNENYYMVKLNAESQKQISFKGKNYNYVSAGNGRRGHHQLAKTLTSDQLSYPSFAVLNSALDVRQVGRGFKNPDAFLIFLEETEM